MRGRIKLRPAREVIEEIERRAQREESEAAEVFAATMTAAIERHQPGQTMRLQVHQAHVRVAVEMLKEAGYRHKVAASHPLDGDLFAIIEVYLSSEGRDE